MDYNDNTLVLAVFIKKTFNMDENKTYDVVKDIPLKGHGIIKAGSMLGFIHGVYYLDGGMLPRDLQEDFKNLVRAEELTGWNYLVPTRVKTAFEI